MGEVEEWNALHTSEHLPKKYYYTNMRDHIMHCATLWRRQYRAFMTVMGTPAYLSRMDAGALLSSDGSMPVRGLDSLIVDEEHTMHCSEFLVEMTEAGKGKEEWEAMPIQVEVGFAGCHVMN